MTAALPQPSKDSDWTVETLRQHMIEALAVRDSAETERNISRNLADAERDRRYQERFEAQTKALDAAFLAQQCVESSVRILCSDLVWRPAGDLRVGDELVAFDETPAPGSGRGGRRFRRAVVTANTPKPADLLLVTTTGGAVKCNPEHPWLVKTGHDNTWRWRPARDIRPGLQVMQIMDVWEVDRSWEGGWLAGMYDGEGWLTFSPTGAARLGIAQSDGPTADNLLMMIKERLGRDPVMSYVDAGRYHNSKGINRCQVSKRADVMKFLGSIRPPRLLVHADRVWEDASVSGDARAARVLSVESAGTGTVASLTTSTGTYIAEGFAMHNTAMQTALTAAERAVQAALLNAKEAAATLATATNQRLETMNEFRGTVQDVLSQAMPRAEAEARLTSILEKMADAARRADDAQKQLTTALATLDSRVLGGEQRDAGHGDSQTGVIRLAMLFIGAVGVVLSIYLATR